jgi:hypothetical protein
VDPFQDDKSLANALLELETTSPVLDTPAQRELKQSKNALRASVKNNALYTDSQIERINEILQNTEYDQDLSVDAKQKIIDEVSAKVNEILTEDIKKRHDEHIERQSQQEIEELFGDDSIEAKPNDEVKEKTFFEKVYGREKTEHELWLESMFGEEHHYENLNPERQKRYDELKSKEAKPDLSLEPDIKGSIITRPFADEKSKIYEGLFFNDLQPKAPLMEGIFNDDPIIGIPDLKSDSIFEGLIKPDDSLWMLPQDGQDSNLFDFDGINKNYDWSTDPFKDMNLDSLKR